MNKTIIGTAIFFGASAVILGAFGAHGLEKLVDPDALQTFETGTKYQMYHALFLLFLGSTELLSGKNKKLIYYLITAGVVCFSFSLYLLAINDLTSFDFKILGPTTPIGGVLLILGWLVLAHRIFKQLN